MPISNFLIRLENLWFLFKLFKRWMILINNNKVVTENNLNDESNNLNEEDDNLGIYELHIFNQEFCLCPEFN